MEDILVPLGLFAMVFGIVFASTYFGYMNRRQKYQIVEKMLDQGTATPELIEKISGSFESQKSVFGKALSLMLTGVALAVFFALMTYSGNGPKFLIAIGLFPFAVGLGRLIGYYHDKKEDVSEIPANG